MFVAPAGYPLGGVATWLDYVMPGLEARGMECVLALCTGDLHPARPYLDLHPWRNTIEVERGTGTPTARRNAMLAAINQVQPDVVIVTNIVDAYAAIRKLRLRGAPSPRIVMALHGIQSDLLEDVFRQSDLLNAVITPNRFATALATTRLSLDAAQRSMYAPCGVPFPDCLPSRAAPTIDNIQLLFVGRIEQEQKRVFDLPRVMHALKLRGVTACLNIIGTGPDEAALRAEVDRLGMNDAIHLCGEKRGEALARAYRAADVLLITSTWETGPLVAWEAMSYGLPIVSSAYVGSVLENALISGETCMTFEIGDAAGAATQIVGLFECDVWSRIRSAAIELGKKRYSEHVSVSIWQRCLSDLMALPNPLLLKPTASTTARGRLDKFLGNERAEWLRTKMKFRYRHVSKGDEWPHSDSMGERDVNAFWADAAALETRLMHKNSPRERLNPHTDVAPHE